MEEGGEEASSHHCFDFRWAHVFYYLTFLLRQDGQRCLALARLVWGISQWIFMGYQVFLRKKKFHI